MWTNNSRSSTRIPTDPACYPDFNGICDAGCVACDGTLTNDDQAPDNFMLPVPVTQPFADPGTPMLSTSWRIYTTVPFPDAGVTATLSAYNSTSRALPSASTVVIERTLGAPGAPLLDGVGYPPSSADVSTLPSATPTVTWTAPTLGTPDYYRVNVVEFQLRGSGTISTSVATLRTSGTTVKVPDGVLVPGHIYYVRLTAVREGNDPDDARHTRRDAIYERAEIVSGLLRVE